jgi:hypothetical protein
MVSTKNISPRQLSFFTALKWQYLSAYSFFLLKKAGFGLQVIPGYFGWQLFIDLSRAGAFILPQD